MGGYGAIKSAMKHPEIFSSVYGLSPASLDHEDLWLNRWKSFLEQAINASQFDNLKWQVQVMIAQAAAFSPDSSRAPFLADFPIDSNGEIVESVWSEWLLHNPISMVNTFKANLAKLKYIQFDCGNSDVLLTSVRNFSQKLRDEGISHEYIEFDGNHSDKIQSRISDYMLPFFSNAFHEE